MTDHVPNRFKDQTAIVTGPDRATANACSRKGKGARVSATDVLSERPGQLAADVATSRLITPASAA